MGSNESRREAQQTTRRAKEACNHARASRQHYKHVARASDGDQTSATSTNVLANHFYLTTDLAFHANDWARPELDGAPATSTRFSNIPNHDFNDIRQGVT